MHILLVEDNESIIKGLKYTLERSNYKVSVVSSIKELEEFTLNNNDINLMILDITLPDGNAFKYYKSELVKCNIPTIFLTAEDAETIVVDALTLADDYLTKPFSTSELLVRINKILKRYNNDSIIKVKDISFDTDKMVVYKSGSVISLTSLELKILQILFINMNKVVSREYLLDKILEWTGNFVDNHTITVYMQRIREKVGKDIIKTVKGIGYRIDEE